MGTYSILDTDTDVNSEKVQMDMVPGRDDVGVEIPTLGGNDDSDKRTNAQPTATTTDSQMPTTPEPTELRRSLREESTLKVYRSDQNHVE